MKKFIYIFIALVSIFNLSSCRDDEFELNLETGNIEGTPVKFEVNIADLLDTRSEINDSSKKSFKSGELIHIRGVFKCKDLDNPGEFIYKNQYGVMKYAGKGTWNPLNSTVALSWPGTAVSASFTAYYINGSTGVLSGQTMDAKLLSDYKFGEDPLFAENIDVPYGHTVRLEMSHIFSYFTISEMSSGITGELFFTIPKEDGNSDYENLNNAFRLKFNPETYEMTPEFTREPSKVYKDSNDEGLVFIEGEGKLYETDEGIVMTQVSYFLEPKKYHKFSLLYPRTRNTTATYMTYNRDLTSVIGEEGFVANGAYEFSILKSMGVVVVEEPNDGWDDKSDPWVLIDVEKFLRAANAGTEYWEPDPETGELVQILESTIDGSKLIRNVDFHNFYYEKFGSHDDLPEFTPDLTNTFEGGYHYIFNMACPLFNSNNGIIRNLGIRNVNSKDHPLVSNENLSTSWGGTFDTSYNGAIARINYGTVSNIRVINLELEIKIQTSHPEAPTREAHNASFLFGSNRGNVYDLRLAGAFKITVKNNDDNIMPQVIIGGLAGQNLGTISGVATLEDDDFSDPEFTPSYTIINECQGDNGVYLAGGIVGNNTGNIYDVLMSGIKVDGTQSQGVESRMGGMIGNIAPSNANPAQISGCIIRGNVKAGVTKSVTNIDALSYIGGLAGSTNIQAFITNCSVAVGVTGTSYYDNLVTYGAGGAFGRIEATVGAIEGSIQTLAAFGSTLSGNVNVGNFAGIAPIDYEWAHWANNGVNVKQYTGRENIGAYL